MTTFATYSPNIIFTLDMSTCALVLLSFPLQDKCIKINFPYYDSLRKMDQEFKGNVSQSFEPMKIPVDLMLQADYLMKNFT